MAAIDVSAAYDLMPTTLAYYYVRQTAFPATYAAAASVGLFQTIPSLQEPEASGGFYQQLRCSFKIPNASITGHSIVPHLGDKIIDSLGVDWTAVDSHQGLASWTIGAVRFTIGGDQVDWRKVNQETNAFGNRITDPATFPLGGVFTCRVQPADNTILDQFGKRGAMQHYAVYLLSDQKFTYGDLLIQTNAANRKFGIVDWRSREDIQNAMVILCEVLP